MEDKWNARELFQKVINFEPGPRTLKWELGYFALSLKRWYGEGLPRNDNSIDVDNSSTIFGQTFPLPYYFGNTFEERNYGDIASYFDLDEGFIGIPVNYWLFPAFEEEIIYENNTYIELNAQDGIRKREYKDRSSMPLWLEYPVRNREDWERIKEERFSLPLNHQTSVW